MSHLISHSLGTLLPPTWIQAEGDLESLKVLLGSQPTSPVLTCREKSREEPPLVRALPKRSRVSTSKRIDLLGAARRALPPDSLIWQFSGHMGPDGL